jgi:hypothetical protein
MMENVGVWASLKRSRYLVNRSLGTSFGAVLIMFLLPALIAGTISFVVNITAKALDPKPPVAEAVQPDATATAGAEDPAAAEAEEPKGPTWNWSLSGRKMRAQEMTMQDKVKHTFLESLIQIFWVPMQIFVFSFSGIIVALLYLKTRLAGGESMNDLIERFEDDGRPRKKWQERVRQRLIQSGRIPSNP